MKVVASDFDGTILKHGAQKVDDIYFELIRRLKEKGISFIAASGREYSSMKYLLEPVKDDICFICLNGSLIRRGDEIIHFHAIEQDTSMELISDMQTIPGTEIIVSGADACYMVPHDMQFVRMLTDKVHNNVVVLTDFCELNRPLSKISIHWPGGIPETEEKWFHEKYDSRLNVVDGGGGWLDFTNKGVDKGSALLLLSEKLNFRLEEVISFGDSENDIAMLQATGISYAMNTAKEHVKASAMYECEYVSVILEQLLQK